MRIVTKFTQFLHVPLDFFNSKKAIRTAYIALIMVLSTCGKSGFPKLNDRGSNGEFDGERAYELVKKQVEFGPRIPGSEAHKLTGDWLIEELVGLGWTVSVQEFEYGNYPLRNIVAMSASTSVSVEAPILLGAHYDSRLRADLDDEFPGQPVPGANDGASGVAVLLELARVLQPDNTDPPLMIVFFDAEDNGRLEGWDWILGSRYFVENLDQPVAAALIVDMVGDADLQLYFEMNSDERLRESLWEMGGELGYSQFIPEVKHSILDDHTPFLQAGIPAVDIIDFDYPYYHTTADLPDKVSSESLEAVGRTLQAWLGSME